MDIGVEDLFDLELHLVVDEDEAAGRHMVVCGLDEDGTDELFGEDGKGREFPEVGFGGGGVREGKGGRTAAGGEERVRGAVGMRMRMMRVMGMKGTRRLLNLNLSLSLILDVKPVLVLKVCVGISMWMPGRTMAGQE